MTYADMMAVGPDSLREHYAGVRALAYNNASIATYGVRTANKCARSMGYLMRQVSMCETAARKRGFSLASAS
jgi:hypothetical protein